MGWALGYVLEILAFMLTASVAARGLFLAYPLVVGLPALAVMRSRRPPAVPLDSALPPPRSFAWLLAAVCIAAVTYISLAYPDRAAPGPGERELLPGLSALDSHRGRREASLADRRPQRRR